MKRYWLLGLIILSYLTLIGCASNRNPNIRSDFTEERWMHAVPTSPNAWARGADSWFLNGEPSSTERDNRHAPYSAAMSTMMVKVPDFTRIKVQGDFQVQLFGSVEHNSVFVIGPNDGVRKVSIEVRDNALCIEQVKDAPYDVKKVIVRIGVRQLASIKQTGGCSLIEGVRLKSDGLSIMTTGTSTSNMYLAGMLNLNEVSHAGMGKINVFGARSSGLMIKTSGRGAVNVSGNVRVRSIYHSGNNQINIIGANGLSPFKIYAEGAGKIGINGQVNIQEIIAKGQTSVYVYPVNSQRLHTVEMDQAHIGLAGVARDLYVETAGESRFFGRRLCTHNAYVTARDKSHVNVAATNKIFVTATQRSSVYYFGSTDILSSYVDSNAILIPFERAGFRHCPV